MEVDGYNGLPDDFGPVFDVFLYDVDRMVYCCELTGSRELEYVGWTCDHAVSERWADWLDEAGAQTDSVLYMHHWEADKLPGEPFGEYETTEEAIEDYHANPIY